MQTPAEISKMEMLQHAIASQQQITPPPTSTSPMGMANPHYRGAFKPNQALMNAGQQMVEQKENYGYRGNQDQQQMLPSTF